MKTMATGIPLKDDIYNQVVERARALNKTPEEWLDQAIGDRLRRETATSLLERATSKNYGDMAARGIKPSDVQREIADHRRGR